MLPPFLHAVSVTVFLSCHDTPLSHSFSRISTLDVFLISFPSCTLCPPYQTSFRKITHTLLDKTVNGGEIHVTVFVFRMSRVTIWLSPPPAVSHQSFFSDVNLTVACPADVPRHPLPSLHLCVDSALLVSNDRHQVVVKVNILPHLSTLMYIHAVRHTMDKSTFNCTTCI